MAQTSPFLLAPTASIHGRFLVLARLQFVPGSVIEYDNNNNGPIASDSDLLVRGLLGTQYGDFNLDGRDNGDLQLLLGNWGDPGGWADANGDGSTIVDNVDLSALTGNWGFGVPTVAIPEPATGFLLVVAISASRKRR